jgi:glycosyltransferase involved in cell wall biosynthesis
MMSFAGIVVAKLKRIPSTMYVLDLWPENLYSVLPIRNRFLRWVARAVSHWHYRRVDQLIALSETMKDKLFAITKNPHIAVIPQAAEKIYEQKASDPKLRKRFADTFNVVFTGNISPAQDPETMVAAAEILYRKGLKDIRWIIVGDGMSRKSMEQSVKDRGLAGIFSLEGQKPIEDMPKYGDIADVLVGCLVKSELLEATIPAKVMSYIAMSKPIVLAMDGEVQDLISYTIKCGYAGAASDATLLSANIQKLYNLGPAKRDAMGDNARKYHKKYFSREVILGGITSLLDGEGRKR